MAVKVRERPKGSGVWWIFIDHRRRRKAKKIGRDKHLALEAARKLEAKLTLGDLALDQSKEKVPTFKEYAEGWLHGYIKTLRRESTFARYRNALTLHVLPTLGHVPIDEIKRGDLRTVLLKLFEKGLSRSSIALIRDVISGPLGHAVDEELIPVNPVTGVLKNLQLQREDREEIDPLTHEEVALFLETCHSHYPEFYPFFLCAFRTGMRLGELLGLQWGDIDWNGKFCLVRRSHRRGCTGPTKTGKSRRVDLSDQLLVALRQLYLERKREALGEGSGGVVGFLFHRGGKTMEQNFIRRIFKRILAKAGIREIRLHDIRHTYAGLLLSNGESPVYVKEQLGHSSITITVDIYGRLIPSSNRQAVNRLDQQLSATYPQPTQIEKAQLVEIAP